MWWWFVISWLVGVGICLFAVNMLWSDGGDELKDRPWEKR